MKTIYAVALAAVLIISIGCGPTEPPAKGSRTTGARMMAEEFIKDKLKAPGTAEFSDSSDTRVRYDETTDSYTVLGWVDAQNSFGAKLRTPYICTVRNTEGDKWQSRNCTLVDR